MREWSWRHSLAMLSVTGLVLAALPALDAGASPSKSAPIGNKCLVGTWRDNGGTTTTRMQGHTVTMHAGGGGVDHIAASGRDRDNWKAAKPLRGHFRGHPLTERVRGTNTLLLRTHGATIVETEKGWSKHASNRYVYRGKHSTGYLDQTGTFRFGYRCSATTLTFLSTASGHKGKVVATETRLSSKP